MNSKPRAKPDLRLAEALRLERGRRGISQESLAHAAGLTVAAFARVERGQANPSWTTVCGIAAALGMTMTEFARAVERVADGEP
jgi:transcriptional regulator with XRE-family HTH domain